MKHLSDHGLLDPKAFVAACRRLLHGLSGNHWRFFIGALSLERWLQTYSSAAHQRAHLVFMKRVTVHQDSQRGV